MKLPFGIDKLFAREVEKKHSAFREEHLSNRPGLDFITTYGSLGPWIPRYPRPLTDLYEAVRYSDTMQIVLGALKSEIFRNGYEVVERFVFKCVNCEEEYDYEIEDESCPECKGKILKRPDPEGKKKLKEFAKRINYNNQDLMELCMEFENDLNIVDNGYVLAVTDYLTDDTGRIISTQVQEFIRISPVFIQKIADAEGKLGYDENGNQVLICPIHREKPYFGEETQCTICENDLYPAYYKYASAMGGYGGKSDLKYYLDSEIFHTSKFNPSLLYGFPPTFSIWMKIHALMGQDKYIMDTYTKQRAPKGMLVFATRAAESLRKSWDELLLRVKANPNYVHPMAIETESGGKEFAHYIDFMKSLDEMQYSEQRTEFRNQIGALYGVQPIFQGDVSTSGGLNNEGLQITVTNRAVERGQKIYNDKLFEWIVSRLDVTDCIIQLLPSEERDEMSELQMEQLRIQNAMSMLQMGFKVELQSDGVFEYSGEAQQSELMGYGIPPYVDDEFEDAETPQGSPFSKELKKRKDTGLVQKKRIYLREGEKAPEGATPKRGPRGGMYYESSSAGSSSSDVPDEAKQILKQYKQRGKGEGESITLPDKAHLETVLTHGTFSLISAGRNPNSEEDAKLSEDEIDARSEQLANDLKEKGYVFSKGLGNYGEYEDSYLVMTFDAKEKDMLDLGKKYNQESVIITSQSKNKMVYTSGENTGKHHPGESWQELPETQDEFFTELKFKDGRKFKFSLNFDNLLEKAIVYVSSLSDVPEGASPIRGRRGGIMYDTAQVMDVSTVEVTPELKSQVVEKLATHQVSFQKRKDGMESLLDKKVSGRVKNKYSVMEKMERNNLKLEELNDLSGYRVRAKDTKDLRKMVAKIENSKMFKVHEVKDKMDGYGEMKYRGVHLIMSNKETPDVKYEMQFTTNRLDKIHESAHRVYKFQNYETDPEKKKLLKKHKSTVVAYFANMSDHFFGLDNGISSPEPDCPDVVSVLGGCL
jgi:ppGpp synthetase/RelA/SpoT-type nucleotidyltranferase/DNA-directed RNA polymerase subunit RPC12/RpoP